MVLIADAAALGRARPAHDSDPLARIIAQANAEGDWPAV